MQRHSKCACNIFSALYNVDKNTMGGENMKGKAMAATLLAIALLLTLCGCGKESRSIGIIGGADGPTAIFVGTPNKE